MTLSSIIRGLKPIPFRSTVKRRIEHYRRLFDDETTRLYSRNRAKTARPIGKPRRSKLDRYFESVREHDLRSAESVQAIIGIDGEPITGVRWMR